MKEHKTLYALLLCKNAVLLLLLLLLL